jgi:hypothetical protein
VFTDANRRDAGPSEPDAFVEEAIDAAVPPGMDGGGPGIDAYVSEADAGVDDMTPTDPFTGPVEGVLVGVVSHAETAALLAGVSVTMTPVAGTAMTDAAGHYTLPLAPGDYVAHFSRDGFLSVHRRVHVEGWERVVVNVSLLPAAPGVMVDGDMGGTVETEGTRVNILGTSLVDSSGMPVEDAEVAVTPIDPVTELDGAPGDFVGESATGTEDPLVSYGMVDIEITTSTGRGDFAEGTEATIEVPVGELPPGDPPILEGECMPLWWFDPERAIWVEEGEACAVRSPSGGLVLTGNVGRPGTWNCDRPVEPVCYTGRVTDCGGMPMPGVEIRLTGGSVTSSTTTRTALDGTYTVTGAARVGAIIEARSVIAGNTYVEQTDFVNGGSGCTPAPGVAFPFRYVAGSVTASHSETHTFRGGSDSVVRSSGSAAQFWDIVSGPIPYLMACDAGAADELAPPEAGETGIVPTLEVGNPVTLTAGADVVDLFRVRRGTTLQSYGTSFGTSLPSALGYDVTIRGAAGSVPFTTLRGALRVPSSFAVTSPPADSARIFDAATGVPLRWATVPGESAEVSVLIFSRADPTSAVQARLTDDGAETLSVAAHPALRGPVTITMTRAVRRYEPLPIGPAVMLVGQRSMTFDAEIR